VVAFDLPGTVETNPDDLMVLLGGNGPIAFGPEPVGGGA